MTDTLDIYEVLEAGRKKTRMIYMMYGGIYLLALGCYLLNWQAMLLVIACNVILYLAFFRPQIRAFRTESKELLLRRAYGGTIKDLRYVPKGGMAEAAVRGARLVPCLRSEGFLSREYVTGRYGKATFEQADITMHRKHPDDPENKNKVVWLSGSWCMFTCEKERPVFLAMWETALYTQEELHAYLEENSQLVLLEREKTGPLADFTVCTDDGAAALALLEGGLAREIKLLREAAFGPVFVGLEKNRLHVLLKGRFGTAEVDFKSPVTPENTPAEQLPEMARVFGLADYLMK